MPPRAVGVEPDTQAFRSFSTPLSYFPETPCGRFANLTSSRFPRFLALKLALCWHIIGDALPAPNLPPPRQASAPWT